MCNNQARVLKRSSSCPTTRSGRGVFSRAEKLRGALQSQALRIDHIGSTAIPSLAAKPVIDIQISVAALDPVDAYGRALGSLGYVFRAENTDLSKRYFREKP